MGMVVDEIFDAATRRAIEIKRSPLWACESLHVELRRRFSCGVATGAVLWESLEDAVSVQDPAGWTVAGEFAGENPCLLSFEPYLEDSVLEFKTGGDLTIVLGECSAFTFYVCDPALTALVCFNDHDFVVGAGGARAWIAEAIRSRCLAPPE